jgi:hypothetical protein
MKITLMAALSIHQALIKPALSPSGWNLQWIKNSEIIERS